MTTSGGSRRTTQETSRCVDGRATRLHDQRRRDDRFVGLSDSGSLPARGPMPRGGRHAHAQLERGSERGLVRSHDRQRRRLQQPDPEIRDLIHGPDASRVAPRQPGRARDSSGSSGRASTPARSRCGPDPTNNLANDNASAFKKVSAAVEPTSSRTMPVVQSPTRSRSPGPTTSTPTSRWASLPGSEDLQDRGLARRRLRVDLRHGDGRSDDVHPVQQDLSRRSALLAGPGDRRQRQHADEEPARPGHQGVARHCP